MIILIIYGKTGIGQYYRKIIAGITVHSWLPGMDFIPVLVHSRVPGMDFIPVSSITGTRE